MFRVRSVCTHKGVSPLVDLKTVLWSEGVGAPGPARRAAWGGSLAHSLGPGFAPHAPCGRRVGELQCSAVEDLPSGGLARADAETGILQGARRT
jgi:hypothetical protein